jgi:hypothetical protein
MEWSIRYSSILFLSFLLQYNKKESNHIKGCAKMEWSIRYFSILFLSFLLQYNKKESNHIKGCAFLVMRSLYRDDKINF